MRLLQHAEDFGELAAAVGREEAEEEGEEGLTAPSKEDVSSTTTGFPDIATIPIRQQLNQHFLARAGYFYLTQLHKANRVGYL